MLHTSQSTHSTKETIEIIIRAKKNANNDTITIAGQNVGTREIDTAINARVIVPIVPANQNFRFLHIHLNPPQPAWLLFNKNRATIKNISDNTPKPKTVKTAIVIFGINSKANSTPTTAPKTILTKSSMQPPQELHSFLQLKLITSSSHQYILCKKRKIS